MTGSEDTNGKEREGNSLAQDVAQDIIGNYLITPDLNVEKVSKEFQILVGQNKLDAALS